MKSEQIFHLPAAWQQLKSTVLLVWTAAKHIHPLLKWVLAICLLWNADVRIHKLELMKSNFHWREWKLDLAIYIYLPPWAADWVIAFFVAVVCATSVSGVMQSPHWKNGEWARNCKAASGVVSLLSSAAFTRQPFSPCCFYMTAFSFSTPHQLRSHSWAHLSHGLSECIFMAGCIAMATQTPVSVCPVFSLYPDHEVFAMGPCPSHVRLFPDRGWLYPHKSLNSGCNQVRVGLFSQHSTRGTGLNSHQGMFRMDNRRIFPQKRVLNTGMGCPGRRSHCPYSCLRTGCGT